MVVEVLVMMMMMMMMVVVRERHIEDFHLRSTCPKRTVQATHLLLDTALLGGQVGLCLLLIRPTALQFTFQPYSSSSRV